MLVGSVKRVFETSPRPISGFNLFAEKMLFIFPKAVLQS